MLISDISFCLRAMQREIEFVYLNFRNHPRGRTMLDALIEADFVPALVIEEASLPGQDGVEEQRSILKKLDDFVEIGDVEALCRKKNIPYHIVENHNDPACVDLIRSASIHLAVLGDTRIIKESVIHECNLGIINVHPGLLPEIRGNNPYVWAILEGKAQGVTVHFIDKGVDTGPILLRRVLSEVPSSYPELIRSINILCGEALVESLRQLGSGTFSIALQPTECSPTRKAASADLKRVAAQKLQECGVNA